jgi:hypothetical protein
MHPRSAGRAAVSWLAGARPAPWLASGSAGRATISWLANARPAPLLAALIAAQLGVVAWLALGTPHNGWVWYSGGDATEYWTSQWAVAHGLIPQAVVGWGLPIFLGWVPLVAGPSLLNGLPVVILVNVFILSPLALILVWALADRLYGRLYAWATATLWVVGPLLAVWAFAPRFRPSFEQYLLAPHWAGLTNMADFPSVVAVLATAWATVRAVQNGRFGSALGAGVVGGILIGIKPANGYFLPAVIVLLVAWRRPRVALGWAIGILPAVLTLAIWKARGLGTIPILSSYAPRYEAGGSMPNLSTNRYLSLDWHHLSVEWAELGEVFWDLRLLQFLVIAGAIGALRRNVRTGLFLGVWFMAYAFLKGMSAQADVSTTSYFRLTLPGLAALAFLGPAIAFLWPGTRTFRTAIQPESWSIRLRSPAAVAAAFVALVPIAVVLLEQPASTIRFGRLIPAHTDAPISRALTPQVTKAGGAVRLSWRPTSRPGSTRVTYAIFRTTGNDGCSLPPTGSRQCIITAPVLTSTAETTITDRPGRGHFWYRVAAVADYQAIPTSTDIMLLGPAVSVQL